MQYILLSLVYFERDFILSRIIHFSGMQKGLDCLEKPTIPLSTKNFVRDLCFVFIFMLLKRWFVRPMRSLSW
jgi:hypothetical protein